jgi:hypothetical protein
MLVRRTSLMGSLSDLLGAHPTLAARSPSVLRAGKPSGAFAHIFTPTMYITAPSSLRATVVIELHGLAMC